jgi:hypothetical protein
MLPCLFRCGPAGQRVASGHESRDTASVTAWPLEPWVAPAQGRCCGLPLTRVLSRRLV